MRNYKTSCDVNEYNLLWDYVTITCILCNMIGTHSLIDNADAIIHLVCSPLLDSYNEDAGEIGLEDFAKEWIQTILIPTL